MSAPPAQGRIVRVSLLDPRGGNRKTRPAVVVSETGAVTPGGAVLVAAITTQLGLSPFSETVAVPSNPAGHPQTGLKKPSEVVCSWTEVVPLADLTDTGGFLPPDVLAEVVVKVHRCA